MSIGTSSTVGAAILAIIVCGSARSVPGDPSGGRADLAGSVETAIERAVRWLPSAETEPFGPGGSFRLYMMDVEAWHRLSVLEGEPARRAGYEQETVRRLRKGLDAGGLRSVLDGPEGREAYTEMAVFARRCADHALDPSPVREALGSRLREVEAEVARVPVPLKALYAAYLPAAGIAPPVPIEQCRATGMLRTQPRETDLTLADVYYLTHEIFAYTGYALGSLTGMTPEEERYLLRVLPFFTVFYLTMGQIDIAAELMTCMQSAGMRDTYAYREGLRVIVERQNSDGSFGTADSEHSGRPPFYLHATMNALTVLLLERRTPRSG